MARPSLPRALLARHVRVGRNSLVPTRFGPATLSYTSLSSCGLSTASGSASLHSASSNPSSSSSSSFTTVNADEISHFSRLSSQWWSETGEFALLHRMNPARVSYIREKVALDTSAEEPWTFENRHMDRAREKARGVGQWLKGMRCLDVGCGGGLLSETLARLGGDVVGVDASKENIGIAKTHAGQDPFLPLIKDSDHEDGPIGSHTRTPVRGRVGSLEYRHTSAELLRDAGEKFDVVCAMEVLEHVDEPGEFMKCLGEMVKPGGHLILSTISRTPLARLLTLTLAEDVLRLVTPGTHTYRKFVRPEELRRFVFGSMGGYDVWERPTGADDVRTEEVGETRGIVYDPLGGRWRLWGGAEGTWGKEVGEECNYMYHVKKRGDAA
ncbi:hypothetical protein JCM24511_03634 [Saitozyma sp. JCM 24511]|nr:hypothetical protein JCM24511_03634 [Saitozyma sp. JCM 24511]